MLKENNVYTNATYKAAIGAGYTFFCGMANSSVFNDIKDAKAAGDSFYNFRNEIHLKTEMRKVCSDVLKLSVGVEDYQRNSLLEYDSYCYTLDYNILAGVILAGVIASVPALAAAYIFSLYIAKKRSFYWNPTIALKWSI